MINSADRGHNRSFTVLGRHISIMRRLSGLIGIAGNFLRGTAHLMHRCGHQIHFRQLLAHTLTGLDSNICGVFRSVTNPLH